LKFCSVFFKKIKKGLLVLIATSLDINTDIENQQQTMAPSTPPQHSFPQDEDVTVFGMTIHSALYVFMLVLGNLSAFFSFLVLNLKFVIIIIV
jgi:tetrahydromethanopterin S-methyltransferase subunit B